MRGAILATLTLLVGCNIPPRLVVEKGLWEVDFNAHMEWSSWDGGRHLSASFAPAASYCLSEHGFCIGLEGEYEWGHLRSGGTSTWYFGLGAVPTFTMLFHSVYVEGWQAIPFMGAGFGPLFYTENTDGDSESDVAMRLFLRAGFKVVVAPGAGLNLEARFAYTSWSDRFSRLGPDTVDLGLYAGLVVFFGPSREQGARR